MRPSLSAACFRGVNSFVLLSIPFFLFAGRIMNAGGITERIFRFCQALVGSTRGGLGHVNVVASMIFAGMSGVAVADAAGLGPIEYKAMMDAGYPRSSPRGSPPPRRLLVPSFHLAYRWSSMPS